MFLLLVLKTSLPARHATLCAEQRWKHYENMFWHLEDQHPAFYNEVMKESKRTPSGTAKAATVNTITSCIDKTSYYDPSSKQAK